MSDELTLEEAQQRYDVLPLHRFIGLQVKQWGSHSVLAIDLSSAAQGSAPGTIHGGILATLADVTCVSALRGAYDIDAEVPVTTDMHVRYLRQPKSGPITAESDLVFRGRRLLSSECSIVDGENRELARATATYMIVPRKTAYSSGALPSGQ